MENSSFKINYEKRKNADLFSNFQKEDFTFLSEVQNYIPVYKRFFLLNDTNFNSVNFNHPCFLTSIKSGTADNKNLFNCTIQFSETGKIKKKQVFFKMAPLLDPFKYLIGKYNINDSALFNLPKLNSDIGSVHPKLLDPNNCAYVDSLFSFLSSTLIYNHNFINGVDFYGSFLGISNNYRINVADDVEYLCKSDFFNKNKGTAFQIDDYSFLQEPEEKEIKPPIKINKNVDNKLVLSAKSIDDDMFCDIFSKDSSPTLITLNDLRDNNIDLVDITNSDSFTSKELKTTTIKSSSTCSSRTSHTSNNDNDNDSNCGDSSNDKTDNLEDLSIVNPTEEDEEEDEWTDDNSSNSTDFEEQLIYATLPKFPVQIICMENCDNTFDDLIMNNELTQDEWFSSLLQIIMILITYQKAFSFTHNDLHTNNVMYTETDEKYIYYCYKKVYYKVPTYGRVFKIIDFGRAIYKYDGKLFCSDSFQPGADAATQYNTEPYFNDKKPRLEPNYSFDLCRLACSIFDYIIDDLDEITDMYKCEPIVRLIYEWCLDDNGVNILYKNNGVERYPDFKLYKMIARCVHHHTPQAQLEREEFKHFSVTKNKVPTDKVIINIDNIPNLSLEYRGDQQ
jgi:hypothetical protein